ncbi:MAG TPA: EF-hand domain-containing protein [Rhodanobacteraceae bacterium]|jgi:hypothetical protein|nr:EF-hand domain-containing protein [Rhodanobacteraceae bacterium]
MFRSRILLAALTLVAATSLHAQQAQPAPPAPMMMPPGATPPPGKPSAFDEMDTNHDGFVSREEFMAAQKKRFDEFDTNHDGKIDAREIASSPPLMERNLSTAAHMIMQWDSNGDGIVTADEFKKFSEGRFAAQDKAGTGKIPRPTQPTGVRPPQGPQQKTELKVLPKPPESQPPAQPQPQPQH